MTHFEAMLIQHDGETARLLQTQIRDQDDVAFGAFVDQDGNIDTRHCGFLMSHLIVSWVTPQSLHYHDQAVEAAIRAAFQFLLTQQRRGGCLDLTTCNFASAPDTAFTMNAMINAWYLAEKDQQAEEIRGLMRRLIESCCEGVMNGGFHTPNHRWAISA